MKSLLRKKKAQVWAVDLSVALVIFIGVIFLFYRYAISFAPEDPLINKMISEGGYVSNTLLTSGYPNNWETLTVNQAYSIGLMGKDGIMNQTKIDKLEEWDDPYYYELKAKLNTRYDYYINFTNAPFSPIGKEVPDDAKQVVKIERLVAYHDNEANSINTTKLVLYLWTKNEA